MAKLGFLFLSSSSHQPPLAGGTCVLSQPLIYLFVEVRQQEEIKETEYNPAKLCYLLPCHRKSSPFWKPMSMLMDTFPPFFASWRKTLWTVTCWIDCWIIVAYLWRMEDKPNAEKTFEGARETWNQMRRSRSASTSTAMINTPVLTSSSFWCKHSRLQHLASSGWVL